MAGLDISLNMKCIDIDFELSHFHEKNDIAKFNNILSNFICNV